MLTLILGAAASGKSDIAEEICARQGKKLAYIATMQVCDAESQQRVEKHRLVRANKNFDTIECAYNLHNLALKSYDCALLECMSNLVANEQFTACTPVELLVEQVLQGVVSLQKQVENLVIVSNMVFGDAERYSGDVAQYLLLLGQVNCGLARRADLVIESVCGLPLVLKGELF